MNVYNFVFTCITSVILLQTEYFAYIKDLIPTEFKTSSMFLPLALHAICENNYDFAIEINFLANLNEILIRIINCHT